jgi:hypothetical protein
MEKQEDESFICLCENFKEKIETKNECDQNDLNHLIALTEKHFSSSNQLGHKFINYVLVQTLKLIVQKSSEFLHLKNYFDSNDLSDSSERATKRINFYVQFLKYSIKAHQSCFEAVQKIFSESGYLIKWFLKSTTNSKENELKLNLISLTKKILKVILNQYKSKLPVSQLEIYYVDVFQLLKNLSPFSFKEIAEFDKRLPVMHLPAKYIQLTRFVLAQLKDFGTTSNEFIQQRDLFLCNLIHQISDITLMKSLKEMNKSNKSSITISSNYLYSSFIALNIQLVFCQKTEQNFLDFYEFLRCMFDTEPKSDLDLIYSQQDDDFMVDFNLNYLEIQINYEKQETSTRNNDMIAYLFEFNLNAHVLFFKLIKSISFDYEIILDWLLSNETNFLTYLVRYFKYLINELNLFGFANLKRLLSKIQVEQTSTKASSRISTKQPNKLFQQMDCSQLEQIFEFLNELFLKMKTMKHLFPYNCEPLIKLLKNIVEFEEVKQK